MSDGGRELPDMTVSSVPKAEVPVAWKRSFHGVHEIWGDSGNHSMDLVAGFEVKTIAKWSASIRSLQNQPIVQCSKVDF